MHSLFNFKRPQICAKVAVMQTCALVNKTQSYQCKANNLQLFTVFMLLHALQCSIKKDIKLSQNKYIVKCEYLSH